MSRLATYTDDFLSALGFWQQGWREDPTRRLALTASLEDAIRALPALPPEATEPPGWCFRKRFLVPNNPQNQGDFWPLVLEGGIEEGVASWSTDYEYCKGDFKKELRPGAIACIFRHAPTEAEVVLNIPGLWSRADFRRRVAAYVEAGGPGAAALNNFGSVQSEVILRARLAFEDAFAFGGQVPHLQRLCVEAGISDDEGEDDLWRRMMDAELVPTATYWLEGAPAKRALSNTVVRIRQRLESLGLERQPDVPPADGAD